MLSSILLHLSESRCGEQAVEVGIQLARQFQARIRGLTLLDTRRLDAVLQQCESAAYASSELQDLDYRRRRQDQVRSRFCNSCLSAGLDFDVRCVRANPSAALSHEACFHDLLISAVPAPGEVSKACSSNAPNSDVMGEWIRGGQPILIMRGQPVNRVLLAFDGTVESSRAVQSFLRQGMFPDCESRILALGRTDEQARQSLREMCARIRGSRPQMETGCMKGTASRVLLGYAEKWRADLVVFGSRRRIGRSRWPFSHTADRILKQSASALYFSE